MTLQSESYCQCPMAGYCKTHQVEKTTREHEFCRGVNCSGAESKAWRTAWESGRAPGQKKTPDPIPKSRRIRGLGDIVSMATTAVGIKPCGGCKDRAAALNHYVPMQSAPDPIRTPIDRSKLVKHFIFHMLPLANEHEWVWRKAVARIRANLHRFNGKVVIAIATFPLNIQEVKKYGTKMTLYLSSYDSVVEAFGEDAKRIEFVSVVNSIRGEGVSFPVMLERVLIDDPNHVICYAHNKGGTHGEMPLNAAPHVWREAMWETVIENDDAVAALERGSLAGSLMRHGGTGTRGNWHYSGTFWWMRSADVIARNWAYIQKHYGCVEMWPSVHFKRDEVSVLFADNVGETNDTNYWHGTLLPQLQQWREDRYQITPQDPSISVVIPTINRDSLAATLASIRRQKLSDRDEVIVVADDENDASARSMFEASGLRGKVLCTGVRSHDWGATPRTLGQSHASGDLMVFMDDDDTYAQNAFTAIRYHSSKHPGQPLLFRMKRHDGTCVWSTAEIRCGNVSTQCIAVPRGVKLGTWGTHYAGDYDFIDTTCRGSLPVFIPEVIANYGR